MTNGYTNIGVHTLEGNELRTIKTGLSDEPKYAVEWLTLSKDESRLYMTNCRYGIVCLDTVSGDVIWKVKDTEGQGYSGVCVDSYNNVFVCRFGKDDVIQFSPDG